LDHKYDDDHDVTMVPYHDHRVLKAVPHHDKLSYESYAHYADNGSELLPEITPFEHQVAVIYQDQTLENLDHHYSSAHHTHHELDHHYDDWHDIQPHPYHDHSVRRAFDADLPHMVTAMPVVPVHHSLYGSHYYNGAAEAEPEEDSMVTAHHVHSEETPYEYSSGDHTMNPHYGEPISRTETKGLPVWTETHETHHHEPPRTYDSYYGPYGPTYHISHPELDHKYDDAHDVTPVAYHDHRVLPVVPSPDRLSYAHGHMHDVAVVSTPDYFLN
jgi:hypothetical protein